MSAFSCMLALSSAGARVSFIRSHCSIAKPSISRKATFEASFCTMQFAEKCRDVMDHDRVYRWIIVDSAIGGRNPSRELSADHPAEFRIADSVGRFQCLGIFIPDALHLAVLQGKVQPFVRVRSAGWDIIFGGPAEFFKAELLLRLCSPFQPHLDQGAALIVCATLLIGFRMPSVKRLSIYTRMSS